MSNDSRQRSVATIIVRASVTLRFLVHTPLLSTSSEYRERRNTPRAEELHKHDARTRTARQWVLRIDVDAPEVDNTVRLRGRVFGVCLLVDIWELDLAHTIPHVSSRSTDVG